MRLPRVLRRRRWQVFVALGLLVGIVGALGGFGRSAEPLPTWDVDRPIDLGQFQVRVHSARIVDVDADEEPFEDGRPRVMVAVTLTNTSEETTSFGSGLLGVTTHGSRRFGNEVESSSFHPDLARETEIEVPVSSDAVASPVETLSVWLGARKYAWTNLALSGPAWSVPSWAAIVTDVPVTDERVGS